MLAHRTALEQFNRATHEPATPELQIAPAEELQAELPLRGATIPFWMIPATAAFTFILTVVAVHA